MFQNFLKTAIRHLWKNKLATSINLVGLSVGMTAAVFIFLWVQNELSFDRQHPAADQIYRVTHSIAANKNENWVWENSPLLMADAAVKEVPEVEQAVRLYGRDLVFNINHKLFSEKSCAYIDKNWFNVFKYQFLAGSIDAFQQDPFGMVLTESKAKKYFGNADPVGQVIRVDALNYTVEGVIKENPTNSSFQYDELLNIDGYLSGASVSKNNNWNNFYYITFVKVRPGANKSLVEAKLTQIVNKNTTAPNDRVSLVPLTEMYFETDLQSSVLPHGNRKTTYLFSLLGLLLLVIACINYVNLTTAKASLRSKEISVRKIVGAGRRHLFLQFIAESVVISVLAFLLTVLLVNLFQPVFNSITGKTFPVVLASPLVWKVLAGTLLAAVVLNGIYPAMLLSSFNPLNVFRGRSVLKLHDGTIRKGLVVFQFSLSIALIVGTIVMYRQLKFIQTTNPGYNVSQVVSINIPYRSYAGLKDDARKAFFSGFKQELQSKSSIESVCSADEEIVNVGSYNSGNADWDGRDTTFNPTVVSLSVDADFAKMFKLQLQEGRWFRQGNEDLHNYIISETAEKQFNMPKPTIGQRFTWGGDTGKVIGVVKDFHYRSMHEKIGPVVMQYNAGGDVYCFIKIVPGNVRKALADAETVWSHFVSDYPFSYNFLDDSFATLYKSDIKTSLLIFIFSIITITISALGLFALAAFAAEQRTKEIGIRKVLGATVYHIVSLLSKDFIRLVFIAAAIAFPIAWWGMNKWLADFAYRIVIGWWVFAAAGLFSLLIALITISVQAVKAAVANPVKNLRTE